MSYKECTDFIRYVMTFHIEKLFDNVPASFDGDGNLMTPRQFLQTYTAAPLYKSYLHHKTMTAEEIYADLEQREMDASPEVMLALNNAMQNMMRR